MNLITISSRFHDQETCIEHLESVRWGDVPTCPHCQSPNIKRKVDGHRIGRWNCHKCKSSFNVLSGTMFSKTKVPLPKWFMAIGLMTDAPKGMSSCQLAKHLELTQQTAYNMQQRIRAEMEKTLGAELLRGILEVDETYLGAKPRKRSNSENHPPRRGRGTGKTAAIGVVERGGKVVARVADKLDGPSILAFLKKFVNPEGSRLISDGYSGYNSVEKFIPHWVINHSASKAKGIIHTNTIEGFWALLKRTRIGTHHHYTQRHTNLYLAETCYKYNHRNMLNAFSEFIRECLA